MKLFLASGLDEVEEQFLQFVGPIQGKRIAYCINPTDLREIQDGKRPSRLSYDKDMFLKNGAILVDLDLRSVQHDTLGKFLGSCDGLYISGGNTAYILQLAEESGLRSLLADFLAREDMFYCSTSAGSCRLGSHIRVYEEDQVTVKLVVAGAGRYPMMLIPHRGDQSPKNKQKYLGTNLEYIYDTACPCLCLSDKQALVIDGEKMMIAGDGI